MPKKASKLLEQMRNSKAGWKRKDLDKLYGGYGFVQRHGKGHDVISHPDYPSLRTVLPRRAKELAEKYVSTAVDLIDSLIMLQESEREDAEQR